MFCTKCGYQIKDGYKFCPKCGTPVYVEKEDPKIEKEKEICEVVVETKAEPDNTVTPTTKVKSAKKAKSSLKAKKVNNDTMPQSKFISESLIAKELDIEGVVKKAENGDAEAMLRQAFRFAKNKGENKLEFQEQVLSGLKNLRDRYPELLFVNYDNSISDDESKDVFLSIKSKVKDRYRISYFPSSLSFVEVIGGQRVEIPGLINLEDGGYLCIRYDTHDNKKKLLNQVLLHLLMQLPIKKIQFSFVDLSGNYDEDFFIKNVDPSIYHGRPITSDSQLEELFEELEKRRFDVTRNYGEYSKYCQEHCTIPIPYEFIVLLDENYDNRFRQRLNNIIKSGHKYGVYLILFQNTGELRYPDNCILNPNGNEIYVSPLSNSINEDSFDFSGDFYYFPDNQIDCIPHSSSSHRETISTNFVSRGFGD